MDNDFADAIQHQQVAESELLALMRNSTARDFTITITRSATNWSVAVHSHDADGSSTAKGKASTFPEAWFRQYPLFARRQEVARG